MALKWKSSKKLVAKENGAKAILDTYTYDGVKNKYLFIRKYRLNDDWGDALFINGKLKYVYFTGLGMAGVSYDVEEIEKKHRASQKYTIFEIDESFANKHRAILHSPKRVFKTKKEGDEYVKKNKNKFQVNTKIVVAKDKEEAEKMAKKTKPIRSMTPSQLIKAKYGSKKSKVATRKK